MTTSIKNIIFVLFMLCICNPIWAQIDTLYFAKDKDPCERQKAFYCRYVTMADAQTIRISDFLMSGEKYAEGFSTTYPSLFLYKKVGVFTLFYPNGQVKKRGVCADDEYIGKVKEYFANGQLYRLLLYPTPEEKRIASKEKMAIKEGSKEHFKVLEVYDSLGKHLVINGLGYAKEVNETLTEEGIYKNGLRDSVWIGCYKNGKLCYRETYINGVLKEGISHDTLGAQYTYDIIYQKPSFIKGENGFFQFLKDHVKYPYNAASKGIEGTAYIKFVVENDGTIKSLYCLNSDKINKDLEKEALRVVKKTSGLWQAGTHRAIKTTVTYILPVRFSLN